MIGLSQKKRARVLSLVKKLSSMWAPKRNAVATWSKDGHAIDLDEDGLSLLREVVAISCEVAIWSEAYPREALGNRLVDACFRSSTAEGAVEDWVGGLAHDCRNIIAYVPFFGFHLEPGVEIE